MPSRISQKQRDAYDLCVLQRAGWPKIPAPEKREAHFKRKMRKQRYDDPGQVARLKGDHKSLPPLGIGP